MNSNKIHRILEVDNAYSAPSKMMEILYNKEKRIDVFKQFLELNRYDVSYDWFNEYFQEIHADRKNQKQDFTPDSVGQLLVELIGSEQNTNIVDIAAGTGSLTIKKWVK